MDWLNYHHLRYFWTVAKAGSLARAAAELHVSPPSISEQIRALEEGLGEKLFRREGRRNRLTDAGQIVLGYADDIFALGRELLNAVKQRPGVRALRLNVGVTDSFPKLAANEILKPAFSLPQSVQVSCREGKLEELLLRLAAHRLDLVLSDEPAASHAAVRIFHHPLGDSGSVFCAIPSLAAKLRRGFPSSLHEAPALLPAEATPFRRALDPWFRDRRVQPRVLVECEDLALMKALAADGRGFIALPNLTFDEAKKRYGFQIIGEAEQCRLRFFAITAERRISHPAATVITANARTLLKLASDS